jgi:hypothetical protein
MTAEQRLAEAIKETLRAADNVSSASSTLSDLVLQHHPHLVSDATILRETAILLQHVTQNFKRVATAQKKNDRTT